MTQSATVAAEAVLELPASAPQIRITAGAGSAGQKTWNLRRPVTLLGSKRPAHIILHDPDVSTAHCVIVNTGADVLLFDLHTSGGTYCEKNRVGLAMLKDGDVITLGDSQIQVAIRLPAGEADDSASGLEYVDPMEFPSPLSLSLIHTDRLWTLRKAVVLIGRHDLADIRLDHPDVSARHALLFRFAGGPALFDVGSRTGIWVNGQRRDISAVGDGDRVSIGPFGLTLTVSDSPVAMTSDPVENSNAATHAADPPAAPRSEQPVQQPIFGAGASPPASDNGSPDCVPSLEQPDLDPLHQNIAEAWERLNQWRAQLRIDAAAMDQRESSLTTRVAELDARDAALRGQLHDIQRFNEQVAERERELAGRAALVQAEADAISALKKETLEKDIDAQRRHEELTRREHALAQRWSRKQALVCPHCGKPLNAAAGQTADT